MRKFMIAILFTGLFLAMYFCGVVVGMSLNAQASGNCGAPPPGSTPTNTPIILPTGVPIK